VVRVWTCREKRKDIPFKRKLGPEFGHSQAWTQCEEETKRGLVWLATGHLEHQLRVRIKVDST